MNERLNGLSQKADAAFQAVAATVIQKAKQTGTPVIIWESGRINEISGDQMEQKVRWSQRKV